MADDSSRSLADVFEVAAEADVQLLVFNWSASLSESVKAHSSELLLRAMCRFTPLLVQIEHLSPHHAFVTEITQAQNVAKNLFNENVAALNTVSLFSSRFEGYDKNKIPMGTFHSGKPEGAAIKRDLKHLRFNAQVERADLAEFANILNIALCNGLPFMKAWTLSIELSKENDFTRDMSLILNSQRLGTPFEELMRTYRIQLEANPYFTQFVDLILQSLGDAATLSATLRTWAQVTK